jgi:hypothetical protein
MPIGRCRLCLAEDVALLDSHFMPAALYRTVRDSRFENPHPEIVTADVTLKSPRQVSQYLLCAQCERRLEQGGETWVIPRCWQDPTSFPIREALVAANAVVETGPGFATFAAIRVPDFEPDKLTYFAASLFWRSAVSDWTIHQQRLRLLKLGSYEEELRRYLLGGVFPKYMALMAAVGYGMEERRNAMMIFPFLSARDNGWRQYRCVVPGITFVLFVGKAIPKEIRRLCCAKSSERVICSIDEIDKGNTQAGAAVLARSRQVGAASREVLPEDLKIESLWPLAETMKFVPRDRLLPIFRNRRKRQ